MTRDQIPKATASSNLPGHLRKGAYVRVTKLHATVGGVPPCPRPIYAPGLWNNVLSLPVNYWMEGVLVADVVKTGLIRLDRRIRDGVLADRFFISTRICSVQGDKVRTFNSIYLIETVEPFFTGLRS